MPNAPKINIKGFLMGLLVGFIVIASALGGAIADRLFVFKPLDYLLQRKGSQISTLTQKVINEESTVIDVAERVGPSVVTVSIQTPQRRVLQFNPFGGFSSSIQGGQP